MSDQIARATVDRLTTTWANDQAAIGSALAEIEPTLGAVVEPLADGQLVLCGPGMYVNAAIGCGRSTPLDDDDWATIVRRATEVGVRPAIQMGPTTHPATRAAAVSLGFAEHDVRDAFVRPLDRPLGVVVPDDAGVVIEEIDDSGLTSWQQAAREGFGHDQPSARAVSDLWARAAWRSGDRMFVALDRHDRRPLGSAILHLTDGVATLGGMSTVPSARGRGIQMRMLRRRLEIACAEGCELAASSASNPASVRNLVRAGFDRAFTLETWASHE